MANKTLFQRQNGVDGSEVSLLCVSPMSCTNPGMGSGQAFSGFVDLECDDDGNFPNYTASEMTWDGSLFKVTFTCTSVISLPASDQQYQTVMLPFYYDTKNDVGYGVTMGVEVEIIYQQGSTNGNGSDLVRKTKKGQTSTTNPNVQPDAGVNMHPKKEQNCLVEFKEQEYTLDENNPANNFGVPRFRIFKSSTQLSQYFVLVTATNVSSFYDVVQQPKNMEVNSESQIAMIFVQDNAYFWSQVIGCIASTYNQFCGVYTDNNGYNVADGSNPLYPVTSEVIPINNTVDDPSNDYDTNVCII